MQYSIKEVNLPITGKCEVKYLLTLIAKGHHLTDDEYELTHSVLRLSDLKYFNYSKLTYDDQVAIIENEPDDYEDLEDF